MAVEGDIEILEVRRHTNEVSKTHKLFTMGEAGENNPRALYMVLDPCPKAKQKVKIPPTYWGRVAHVIANDPERGVVACRLEGEPKDALVYSAASFAPFACLEMVFRHALKKDLAAREFLRYAWEEGDGPKYAKDLVQLLVGKAITLNHVSVTPWCTVVYSTHPTFWGGVCVDVTNPSSATSRVHVSHADNWWGAVARCEHLILLPGGYDRALGFYLVPVSYLREQRVFPGYATSASNANAAHPCGYPGKKRITVPLPGHEVKGTDITRFHVPLDSASKQWAKAASQLRPCC